MPHHRATQTGDAESQPSRDKT